MSPAARKKITKPPTTSASRALIAVGRKDVVAKFDGKRDADGRKPTTSKALVLRNGKYGAYGTGEVMLASKLSGREKLDLLAEDYTEKAKKAVAAPFNTEKCLNIADSQYNAYLDDIANLKDPQLFLDKIKAEVSARTPPKNGKRMPPNLSNSSFVAGIVATRIHNAYMLASAWKLVLDTLGQLKADGLADRTAQASLKKNENLKSRYLVLFDMVSKLVDIGQNKFSVLATTTPHYAQYFKAVADTDPDEPEMVFDRDALKFACKSFLDSIILELSFPEAPYSKRILYQILHEAVDESPREAKRFPQELWNAVGDLSVTLELQELLERPLLGPIATGWKDQSREMPEEYEKWVDAQIISEEASKHTLNYKSIIFPLEKTKQKIVLENMWKCVNLNYKSVSDEEDIDTLWQLDGALDRTPQWHSFYIPSLAENPDEDSDGPSSLIPLGKGGAKSGKKSSKKLLAITNGTAYDSADSMPELQSVSDSDSDEDEDESSDEEGESVNLDDGDEDSDDGYDTDEEDELRDMMKEAMNAAMENDNFFDPKADPNDFKAFQELAEERKGNPFLKLLGSLRGRVFNSSPKLKSTTRTVPRRGFPGGKHGVPRPPPGPIPKRPQAKDGVPPSESIHSKTKVESQVPKSQKATVEDVEDEDVTPGAPKKKKKKKPKKKKTGTQDEPASPVTDQIPSRPATPARSPPSSPVPSPSKAPPKKAASVPKSPPPHFSSTSINSTLPHMSTTSLSSTFDQTSARSAHSYLKEHEGPKAKVKSRPDHASIFSEKEKKTGFFSKFTRKDQPSDDKENVKKGSKQSWFSKLNKKTNKLMHQLLNTTEDETKGQASMKWDHFVKLMTDMGFKYDPSTAGSSVRFDPPDIRDPPITFHKPHPDPTIYPMMLKDFSKRLRRTYGWTGEDFLKFTG